MNGRNRVRRTLCALVAGMGLGGCANGTELELGDTRLYAASITALNGSGVTGAAAFEVNLDGNVVVGTEVLSLAAGGEHAQYVRVGAACPASSADADGNGLVDRAEGATAYGLILIPLDDDLADPGPNGFPSGTPIEYAASVDYATLMAHLGAADPDPTDEQATLGGADLAMGERTIVIHGAWILDGAVVPDGTQGATYDASVPVACGSIDRVGPLS